MAKRNAAPDSKGMRRPPSEAYEVGYGKPPVDKRFKPGQSGNPNGRRKGSSVSGPALNEERLKTIVLQEAYRTVTVTDGGHPVTIPMVQAIIRALALAAAKGQQRSQRLFTNLLSTTEQANRALHNEYLQAAIEYKAEWDGELERRRCLGIIAPDPVPHPDHVVIDMRSGTVQVQGPMTREEKVAWDRTRARKTECETTIAELEALMAKQPRGRMRQVILDEIAKEKKIRAVLAQAIGET